MLEPRPMMLEKTYNGWKNYNTWNVALWIQNDEGLYNIAMSCQADQNPYHVFVARIAPSRATQDGVSWHASNLDIQSLNTMIKEL